MLSLLFEQHTLYPLELIWGIRFRQQLQFCPQFFVRYAKSELSAIELLCCRHLLHVIRIKRLRLYSLNAGIQVIAKWVVIQIRKKRESIIENWAKSKCLGFFIS